MPRRERSASRAAFSDCVSTLPMPKSYDIFNGDADGLCALQQLRLEEPREAELVTGVKRDIRLVERVQTRAGDELTVLDVSLKSNADALRRVHTSGDVSMWASSPSCFGTSPERW